MRAPMILVGAIGWLVGGCTSASAPPSLLPRAAEKIDPRVPVEGAVNARPVSEGLAARLGELVAQAQSGDAAFAPLAAEADRLASASGPAQSESWTVAQQALSAATAARAPTTRALSDIDALAANALQMQGGLSPADLAAIQEAAATAASLDRRQAATIERIEARLGL